MFMMKEMFYNTLRLMNAKVMSRNESTKYSD